MVQVGLKNAVLVEVEVAVAVAAIRKVAVVAMAAVEVEVAAVVVMVAVVVTEVAEAAVTIEIINQHLFRQGPSAKLGDFFMQDQRKLIPHLFRIGDFLGIRVSHL